MQLEFSKMHGAGNDFIIADNTAGKWPETEDFIRAACSRKRGIGADGLILLEGGASGKTFKMTFFNCDGSPASMCGNGLRCAALFTYERMGAGQNIRFTTGAGELHAQITGSKQARIEIPVKNKFKEAAVGGMKM